MTSKDFRQPKMKRVKMASLQFPINKKGIKYVGKINMWNVYRRYNSKSKTDISEYFPTEVEAKNFYETL